MCVCVCVSVNEILESRRRARAKKQIEECSAAELDDTMPAIASAASVEYAFIKKRYDYEACLYVITISITISI